MDVKDTKIHQSFFEKAILIRKVEETLLQLFNQGKINGTVHTCVGQEFTGVAISTFLEKDDYVVSNHRGHGHYIARTNDVKGLLSELMGYVDGCSGGIGGSQHFYNRNYLSNGIQGGMTPIATGIALSYKLRKNNNIAIAYIGDGTLGEGVIYETLNLASVWNCPILFVLENNQYAQSTSFKQTFAGNIETRIKGFGIEYKQSSIWDLDHLFETTDSIINYVRQEVKPAFIEIQTYRLNSHSKGDDNRKDEEVASYRKIDPINIFIKDYSKEYIQISDDLEKEIKGTLKIIEQGSKLSSFDNSSYVYSEGKSLIPIGKEPSENRINDIIYESIKEEFKCNPQAIMIGEDIEYINEFTGVGYGGAFKVSKDLSVLFPDRVKNTPISEAAIVGVSNGLAIAGHRAITEIMFGDFSTLIMDQLLQHGAKFWKMYNHKVKVPHLIRTPMGGKRGYGPSHSQSLEKHFLGIPDLHVISLNNRINPKIIYENIFKTLEVPCLLIENKVLYTRRLNENPITGFSPYQSNELFPTTVIRPNENKTPTITIFCYGGMLEEVETAICNAFEFEEIVCEIIAPTRLFPLNIFYLQESVKQTHNLITVEEGPIFAALGSEVVSALLERGINIQKLKRIGNNNIIPSSLEAELNLIPDSNSIYNAIIDMTNG